MDKKTGLYKTLSEGEMVDSLSCWFSFDASEALVDHYFNLSEDLGEMIAFDAVEIRCDWTEYESKEKAMEEYDKTWQEIQDSTETIELKTFNPESERVLVLNF